jgi:hypothetical protein
LDEFARGQDNPAIIIAYRDEVGRCDTERGDRANEGSAIVVVDNSIWIARQTPSRKQVLDQRLQYTRGREMFEKGIRSISSARGDLLWILDHHTEKRTGKRLDDRLLINRHTVSSIVQISTGQNIAHALVGVVVQ